MDGVWWLLRRSSLAIIKGECGWKHLLSLWSKFSPYTLLSLSFLPFPSSPHSKKGGKGRLTGLSTWLVGRVERRERGKERREKEGFNYGYVEVGKGKEEGAGEDIGSERKCRGNKETDGSFPLPPYPLPLSSPPSPLLLLLLLIIFLLENKWVAQDQKRKDRRSGQKYQVQEVQMPTKDFSVLKINTRL